MKANLRLEQLECRYAPASLDFPVGFTSVYDDDAGNWVATKYTEANGEIDVRVKLDEPSATVVTNSSIEASLWKFGKGGDYLGSWGAPTSATRIRWRSLSTSHPAYFSNVACSFSNVTVVSLRAEKYVGSLVFWGPNTPLVRVQNPLSSFEIHAACKFDGHQWHLGVGGSWSVYIGDTDLFADQESVYRTSWIGGTSVVEVDTSELGVTCLEDAAFTLLFGYAYNFPLNLNFGCPSSHVDFAVGMKWVTLTLDPIQ